MQLGEFYDYKNQLINDLLTNEEIIRLLCDNCRVCQDPAELVYEQVFPYEYVPDTIVEGKTFICCDVDIQKAANKTFLMPALYIWVFSHKSKLRLPEGGVRVDKICAEIAQTINGSRYYGLGELDLYSSKRFAPMTDYLGKVLTFHAVDFNRPGISTRSVPSNRRRGE